MCRGNKIPLTLFEVCATDYRIFITACERLIFLSTNNKCHKSNIVIIITEFLG